MVITYGFIYIYIYIYIYRGTILVFKRVEYVIGFIEGQICEIIYMNVCAPLENKCDDTKDVI
jgi:hypothetical protein